MRVVVAVGGATVVVVVDDEGGGTGVSREQAVAKATVTTARASVTKMNRRMARVL
jgi:hypothetical protein